MVISISSELFKKLDNLMDINYLISNFSENRRYNYYCDIEEISQTEVFKSLLPLHQTLIEENYVNVVRQSLRVEYKIDKISTEECFNVQEAKIFFNQPLLIILENNLYDGYFLDALINNFKKKSKLIKKHKENKWLSYHNGGGCTNIINVIQALLRTFDNLPKDKMKYLRCIVIIDSDKEFQTNEIKPEHIKLFKFLDEKNIPYHELEKREIENYLPTEVIESIPEIDDYLETYLQLSPLQKDFFDLEKGFDNKNLNSFSKEVQNLYKDLTPKQISILRKGMCITKFLKNSKFKSEFPKLFENEKVTQDNLLSRTKHQINDINELQSILDKITRLL